jgi:predicted transcriptional regulator
MSPLELRKSRKTLNISQLTLAHSAGVSRWRLIAYEQGNLASLTTDENDRISRVLRERQRAALSDLAELPSPRVSTTG